MAALTFGFAFPCCDRKLNYEYFERDLRILQELPPKLEGNWISDKYCYYFPTAGGNYPFMAAQGLEAFVKYAMNNGKTINLDRVFFTTHSECAAAAAGLDMSPEEGARWFVRIYKAKQAKYPDVLLGQPKLYQADVDTVYSSVPAKGLSELPESLWDEQPLVVDEATCKEIMELLFL